MTIDAINALPEAAFVERFGFLFEHSPWIVEAAAKRRPFADLTAMEAAMNAVIEEAGEFGMGAQQGNLGGLAGFLDHRVHRRLHRR